MKNLPKAWSSMTVADVCDMRNGHGFGPEDWGPTGLPIIRIQNLNGGQKFDYYSGQPDERWLVEPGQMLFSWAGTKGVSFGPTVWHGTRGVLNQHIFKVQPKDNIDGQWLYWALKYVTNRIEAQSHGFKATLVHVKKSDIDRQPISVPPQKEQRRIAQILSTWDQAIATTERLLANSQRYKQALMKSILQPKHSKEWHRNGWERRSLRDVCEIDRESLPSSTPGEFKFRYISLSDIGDSGISSQLTEFKYEEAPSRARRVVRNGDILFSTVRPNLMGHSYITTEFSDCVASTGFSTLTARSGIDEHYIYQYLFSEDMRKQIDALVVGSSFPAIGSSEVEDLQLNLPNENMQRQISILLRNQDAQIQCLLNTINSLAAEKQALMSQLLTGKRRAMLPAADSKAKA
jgi:type I restriction enzyme S subunit